MISIIIKDIKQNFRNRRAFVLMILFPLVLMWILSAVFATQFGSSSLDFKGVTVIYSADEESSQSLLPNFETFTDNLKEMEINFVKVDHKDVAIKEIEDSNYVCYIEISGVNKEVIIYKNNFSNSTASFLEGLVATFIQRYNLVHEVAVVNPSALGVVMSNHESKSFVNKVSLDKKKEVSSLDYYGITMLTLIIMYSINTGMYNISKEQHLKTGDRILESPIAKHKLFLGKVISSFVVTSLQMAVVIIFSIFVLGVNWGVDIPTVLLIIASQILMTISLGMGVAFIVKNQDVGSGIISISIPFMIFLGGGYYPIQRMGSGFITTLSKISPVKWINESILDVIHLQDYSKVGIAIAVNVAIALIMLIVSSRSFTKREEL